MNAPAEMQSVDHDEDWILLTDPDVSGIELDKVIRALRSPRLSAGARVEDFEAEFARPARPGPYGVATASGTLAMWLALRAMGIGPGDEVVACSYGWHQTAHAILLAGATPNFAEIDYWSASYLPVGRGGADPPQHQGHHRQQLQRSPGGLESPASAGRVPGVALIEDSTELSARATWGWPVGSFGDVSVFDFSQPGALCCGARAAWCSPTIRAWPPSCATCVPTV